jgi:hypothetical protein
MTNGRMQAENYREYSIWGHAIQDGRAYLASGTITRDGKLVQASDVLGTFDTEAEAGLAGLDWARAWIDSHG